MTTQEKIIELDKIAREIRDFKGLEIARAATNAVPGEGNPDSTIMFIGEAPGFNEDRLGRPFVGQAGKLLEKTLSEIGLQRSDVFITNVVKFRPPDNRDPFPEEIEACRAWLDRQIAIIQPKIIVTLGRFSMAKFIPDVTISRVHGVSRFVDFSSTNSGVPSTNYELPTTNSKVIVFPMYHPAAALRSGGMLESFRADFQKLKTLIASPSAAPSISPPTQPKKDIQATLF